MRRGYLVGSRKTVIIGAVRKHCFMGSLKHVTCALNRLSYGYSGIWDGSRNKKIFMNHKTKYIPTLQALIKYIGVECYVRRGSWNSLASPEDNPMGNRQSYDLTKNNKSMTTCVRLTTIKYRQFYFYCSTPSCLLQVWATHKLICQQKLLLTHFYGIWLGTIYWSGNVMLNISYFLGLRCVTKERVGE